MIVDGGILASSSSYSRIELIYKVLNLEYICLVFLLGGFDIILGLKWLCTLDFLHLTVKFFVNGKTYFLMSSTSLSLESMWNQSMEKIQSQGNYGMVIYPVFCEDKFFEAFAIMSQGNEFSDVQQDELFVLLATYALVFATYILLHFISLFLSLHGLFVVVY